MKEAMLDEVTSSISNAESIVFAEYRGIDVLGITQLRANSRTSGVKLKVFKNTLFILKTLQIKFFRISPLFDQKRQQWSERMSNRDQ